MLPKRLNQKAEIWLRTAPLCGIGSGRTTSNAESRSVTTNRRVSPRSNTSRTLPLRSFLNPGRSIVAWVATCMGERSTLNGQLSTSDSESLFERPPSILEIEATLHVVNLVAIRLEYRVIAELRWPDVGIVGMNDIPANATFAHTALQVRNVCRLLQTFQLS